MKNRAEMNDLRHRLPRPLFDLGTMHKVSLSSSCSLDRKRKRSSVKKTTAVLKRPRRRKMKGGKVESGTAQRKPGGSNPREAAEDKAP